VAEEKEGEGKGRHVLHACCYMLSVVKGLCVYDQKGTLSCCCCSHNCTKHSNDTSRAAEIIETPAKMLLNLASDPIVYALL
jgi:hypothetical protein